MYLVYGLRISLGFMSFETDLGLKSQRGVPACHTRNVLQARRRAPGQIQKDGRSIWLKISGHERGEIERDRARDGSRDAKHTCKESEDKGKSLIRGNPL